MIIRNITTNLEDSSHHFVTFGMTDVFGVGQEGAVSKANILHHKVHKENSQRSQNLDNHPIFFVSHSVKLCALCG